MVFINTTFIKDLNSANVAVPLTTGNNEFQVCATNTSVHFWYDAEWIKRYFNRGYCASLVRRGRWSTKAGICINLNPLIWA